MSKQIIDEIPGFIRIYNDGSIERPLTIWSTPVSASLAFVNGVATKDVEINPHTAIWARIFLPEPSPDHMSQVETYPVLLHFHGGGFCVGSADQRCYNLFLSRLVKQCRVMCVPVNYRLAPEHRLPAACEDAMESLEWLHGVARGDWEDPWLSRYGDFARCVLVGESAGGNLVHEVAIRAAAAMESLRPLLLCGGIMIHPGFVREQRSRSENRGAMLISTEMVDKLYNLALPEGSTKDHPITNPIGPFAPNLQHLNVPPFLVAIADQDLIIPGDTQFEYCEAMKIAGKSVEVFISKNVGHCFHTSTMDPSISQQTQDLLDAIHNFIKTCCQDIDKYP